MTNVLAEWEFDVAMTYNGVTLPINSRFVLEIALNRSVNDADDPGTTNALDIQCRAFKDSLHTIDIHIDELAAQGWDKNNKTYKNPSLAGGNWIDLVKAIIRADLDLAAGDPLDITEIS